MREVWAWEFGEGSAWRKGRAGVVRGATGREWVERERLWDMPKGEEMGPLGEVVGRGELFACCGGAAAGVGVLWEECCCGCGWSSTSAAGSGPRRNRMGLRLRHDSAAFSSRKMTRLALGWERVSYLRFL
jgi:hypothetical protein